MCWALVPQSQPLLSTDEKLHFRYNSQQHAPVQTFGEINDEPLERLKCQTDGNKNSFGYQENREFMKNLEEHGWLNVVEAENEKIVAMDVEPTWILVYQEFLLNIMMWSMKISKV